MRLDKVSKAVMEEKWTPDANTGAKYNLIYQVFPKKYPVDNNNRTEGKVE